MGFPKHIAKSTQGLLKKTHIKLMEWPNESPDISNYFTTVLANKDFSMFCLGIKYLFQSVKCKPRSNVYVMNFFSALLLFC